MSEAMRVHVWLPSSRPAKSAFFAIASYGAGGVFDGVGVHFGPTIGKEDLQPLPLAVDVGELLAEADLPVGGLVAHQAFVRAHAIDPAFDVVDVNEDVARTKRNLLRMARRVILVADSSKWDIEATSKAFSCTQLDMIITDSDMPHGVRLRLDRLGVEVRYV